ncbi:hypothetical protein WJX84_008330 [Apatococcus fuscideae]|uniref:Uncharacterized protein n=1 Tax=Apatococcus fuscideae TaxID=2026836 RepID=A0AAW1TED5_9CHLO
MSWDQSATFQEERQVRRPRIEAETKLSLGEVTRLGSFATSCVCNYRLYEPVISRLFPGGPRLKVDRRVPTICRSWI